MPRIVSMTALCSALVTLCVGQGSALGTPRYGTLGRGELANLRGVTRGRTYALINPTTGHMDRKARVVSTGRDPKNAIPFAEVRFSNGHVQTYAAERLRLVGRPIGEQRRYMRAHKGRMQQAIKDELGLDASAIRLISVSGRTQMPRRRDRRPKNPGRLLRLFGEQLEPGVVLQGFQGDGRAWVSRHHAMFDYRTGIHEMLHGLSRPFVDQAFAAGVPNLTEGLTDYYAYRVSSKAFGVRPSAADTAYTPYMAFARQVESLIGERRLRRLFFHAQHNPLKRLARAVDRALGENGAFMSACKELERGETPTLGPKAR